MDFGFGCPVRGPYQAYQLPSITCILSGRRMFLMMCHFGLMMDLRLKSVPFVVTCCCFGCCCCCCSAFTNVSWLGTPPLGTSILLVLLQGNKCHCKPRTRHSLETSQAFEVHQVQFLPVPILLEFSMQLQESFLTSFSVLTLACTCMGGYAANPQSHGEKDRHACQIVDAFPHHVSW